MIIEWTGFLYTLGIGIPIWIFIWYATRKWADRYWAWRIFLSFLLAATFTPVARVDPVVQDGIDIAPIYFVPSINWNTGEVVALLLGGMLPISIVAITIFAIWKSRLRGALKVKTKKDKTEN